MNTRRFFVVVVRNNYTGQEVPDFAYRGIADFPDDSNDDKELTKKTLLEQAQYDYRKNSHESVVRVALVEVREVQE